jgi:hypothetical protein
LIKETRLPLPAQPGQLQRFDDEDLNVARKLWQRFSLVKKQWFTNTTLLWNRYPLRQNKFHLPAAYPRIDLASWILTNPQRFWITGRLSLVYHR